MPEDFFGGNIRKGGFGHVQPLQCADFKEFFESQLFAPVRINWTSGQYHNLPEDEQKRAKFVAFFTGATFAKPDPNKKGWYERHKSNVKTIRLVCLDIDPEKEKVDGKWVETGVFPAAPLVADPKTLHTCLGNLNFAAYTTLSHTTDKPRMRVVVEADDFDPAFYPVAVDFIAAKLGLPSLTKESKVAAQAMFRPTVFKDTPANENPVIARNLKGHPLTEDMLQGHTATLGSTSAQKKTTVSVHGLDGLVYLQPQAAGVTLEACKDALDAMDPNCSMDDWIKVAMAFRHQFTGTDDEEAAFELFDEWSSGGSTYEGTDRTRYRWDHVEANTFDRAPVTIRGFFKQAKAAGWDNVVVEEAFYESTLAWIKHRQTVRELTDQAIDKIIATPMLTNSLQVSLLSAIQERAKELKTKLGLSELKKDLKKRLQDQQELEAKKREAEEGPPPWIYDVLYISRLNRFFRTTTGEGLDPESFDKSFARELLPSEKELEARGELVTRAGKATPTIRPQDFALNELKVPVVYDDRYDPKNPDETIITKDRIRFVNTYRKSYPEPDPETSVTQGKIFMNHLSELVAEEQLQMLVMDFIAYLVQFSGYKIRWAVLIQSVKGNGKGLLSKAMRGILGRGNVKTVDPEAIYSNYNDWACGTQVSFMNEIRVTGHSRAEAMNKLKEPISDDFVSINQKFRDHREVENVTNYIMFTNFHDALALDDDERRYLVIKSPLQTPQDIKSLNARGGLEDMKAMVDKGEFGGLRHFFENWPISDDFQPDGPPPLTPYFYEMCKQAAPELVTCFNEAFDEDHPLIQRDLLSSTALLSHMNVEMSRMTNAKAVSSLLVNNNYVKAGRFLIGEDRHQLWIQRNSLLEGLNLVEIAKKRIKAKGNTGQDIL